MVIKENISLKPYNTFGIDVSTRVFAELFSEEDILSFLSSSQSYPKPFLFLGGGSNLLFTQHFSGTVVKISTKGMRVMKEGGNEVFVTAASGENWDDLVKFTVENGWGGLENLSLIPGSVGASPIQNIGAYGVEVKDSIEQVEAIELLSFERRVFSSKECAFGYRDSIFKGELRDRYLILNVTFKLHSSPALKLDYGSIQEEISKAGITSPSAGDVREAVCTIRRSKLPDPNVTGNAGSFFKNPVIPIEQFRSLKVRFPQMGSFPSGDEVKLAAAWLIEQCGWKGKHQGNAGVHEKQPLVLINCGGATGKEIMQLSNEIIKSVKEKFGVMLEREVNCII
ncbi:MAG: UDP-N-acetylmuramate dehydrogenase [Bacteroidota bacterium]